MTVTRPSGWRGGTAGWAGPRTGKLQATAEPQDCREKLFQRQSSRLGPGTPAIAPAGAGGCDDTGLWSGRLSGQRRHSRGILQRPRGLQGGGAENRGFRKRTSDGVCNRFLGLMQPWPGISTVLPTLTYLFPSHLCQQGQEKKMRH